MLLLRRTCNLDPVLWYQGSVTVLVGDKNAAVQRCRWKSKLNQLIKLGGVLCWEVAIYNPGRPVRLIALSEDEDVGGMPGEMKRRK